MNVFKFPTRNERDWLDSVAALRSNFGLPSDAANVNAAIDECLPRIRAHWEAIWKPCSISFDLNPQLLTDEQCQAIDRLVERVALRERMEAFAQLAVAEVKVAYINRHGPQPWISGAGLEK